MAIPFLSDIKLNGNQIRELVVDHKSGSHPSSGYHGQLIFRSDQNKVYLNTSTTQGSPTWLDITSGDITSVAVNAGEGLEVEAGSDSATTGDFSVTLGLASTVAGGGLSYTSGVLAVGVDDSTIELNSDAVRVKADGIDLPHLKHQTANTVLKMNGSGVPTAGTVDTVNITDDAVDGTKIADDAINSEHYVDGSIDTDHIADDQVTYAKIQNVSATNRILGRDSANAGIIEEITPANVRTMLNVEDGANNYSLDLSKLNTVTSAMTGTDTLTFGDSGDDTQVTIKGNLTVIGKTTTNNVETVSTSSGVIFEGSAADGNDATMVSVVAGSSKTYTLPNIAGYVPILTNDPGTTAISATADEINKIDGFLGDHNDLNYAKDLRATGVTATEYDTLDGITATTTELNILDGDTSASSSITIADADRFVMNDAGTMKQIAASDVKTYIQASIASREFVVELDATESSVTKSSNTYTVTHGLGTRNVLCQVIEHGGDSTASTNTDKKHQTVNVDIDRPDNAGNTVDVMFGSAVTDGAYKILITKIG